MLTPLPTGHCPLHLPQGGAGAVPHGATPGLPAALHGADMRACTVDERCNMYTSHVHTVLRATPVLQGRYPTGPHLASRLLFTVRAWGHCGRQSRRCTPINSMPVCVQLQCKALRRVPYCWAAARVSASSVPTHAPEAAHWHENRYRMSRWTACVHPSVHGRASPAGCVLMAQKATAVVVARMAVAYYRWPHQCASTGACTV